MGLNPQKQSPSVEKYGLAFVRPYHREIARRLILGEKQSEIARDIGMTASRMSIICNSPLFKLELRRLEMERDASCVDVTKTLRELSPVALEQVERTMYTAKSQRLRYDAASSILDRAGYGAINKQDIRMQGQVLVKTSNMTDDELRRLVAQRVDAMNTEKETKEKAEVEGAAIEVEYETVDAGQECSAPEQQFDEYNPVKDIVRSLVEGL